MTEVSAISAKIQPTTKPAEKTGGFAGGDFETFLKMLTTQIKNQDPLNPMEGSDFAVQLATFSGVEQQVQTNDLLQKMVAGSTGSTLADYSSWIGKSVRTTAPVLFDDSPLTLDLRPDAGADKVTLVTVDRYGRDVLREEIGPGTGQADWFGRDSAGTPLPSGLYSFRLESYRGDDLLSQTKVGAYTRVEEAEKTKDGVRLILSGGATAAIDQIEAVGT